MIGMIDPSGCQEIWVDGPHGQSLCALINGDVGWLMYLRESGDCGFSSRNPDYDGPSERAIKYMLSNGQVDEYPASWSYPVEVVIRALEDFRANGLPPPFIAWHNDSGDGQTLSPGPSTSFKPKLLRNSA